MKCNFLRYWPELIVLLSLANGFQIVPAAARTIVIKASGPSANSFAPGTLLQEPLALDLARGDRITVLDEAGTRVLIGPSKIRDVAVRSTQAATRSSLATILRLEREGRMRTTTGGVRSVDDTKPVASVADVPAASATRAPMPPSLFHIDPTIEGDWCINDAEVVELWRQNADQSTEIVLTSPDGATASARWSKGETGLFWPGELPPQMNARYLFQLPDGPSRYITLHHIALSEDIVSLAQALADNLCDAQLNTLVENGG